MAGSPELFRYSSGSRVETMHNPRSGKAQDDDAVMGQVELALAQPPEERDAYIQRACGGDSELIAQVRNYVHWEETMNRFLLDPVYSGTVAEHRFEPGERLAGRFRIVRLVAEGGMGVVYEAWDEKLERRIAVKCAKAGFDKRLLPEVRHASEISHPNVCKIYEIHTASTAHGETDFFTMEFLEGETLADRLRRGPLPASGARSFARQICAGLAEAHRHGVIHGDLKSNNVILAASLDGGAGPRPAGSDGGAGPRPANSARAVITDFGLARGPAASTPGGSLQSAEAGGAPDYMAPELWYGKKASAASDVYALGVILYELESGRRPFGLDVPLEDRPTRKPPPLHAKWDRVKLDPVLARCLDPVPARRFHDAGEVAQALEPARPLPWWLMAAAAVLAIVVGVATYERATTPKESWRLAMLPVESSPEMAAAAGGLSRDAALQLDRLKGGDVARLAFIPPGKPDAAAGATHLLHAALEEQDGKTILHAVLTDARSKVNVKDWTAEYTPGEVQRYAPVALAGMVTGALNLPPLPVPAVNAAARKDYEDGVEYTRQNSTLDKALATLERAVKEDPDSPLTYAALAEAQRFKYYLNKDDPAWLGRTKDSLRLAEARNPDVPAAHRVEGYLYYDKGSYEPAIPEFERAIKLQPGNAMAYIYLGKAYEDSAQDDAQLEKARTELLKASEVEPNYFRTWQNLGAYYQNRANFSEMARYHQKAVELAPNEPNLHSNLGDAYVNLGNFPAAAVEYRLSLDQEKTLTAEYDLGLTLMYENNDLEAVEHFKEALKLDSPQGLTPRYQVLMYLGIADRHLHDYGGAKEANTKGLNLAKEAAPRKPHDGDDRAFLGYFKAALRDDAEDAEEDIATALGLFPNDSEIRWTAVLTYEELHRRFKDQASREKTLAALKESTADQLNDVKRWPDLEDLHKDPRFTLLLSGTRQVK